MGGKLAVFGGKPVRDSFLPYGRQWISKEDKAAVERILDSPYLTTGPAVAGFERKTAACTGAKYAVSFSSGTAALHAACFTAGIREGDEVITSPLTFAASANCILYCGGTPVFVDVDPRTYLITAEHIEAAVTERTKAVIPVDFTGQPADYDAIRKVADKYNLLIIEDAAHALGASYRNQKIGAISDMTMFSFHPVKPVTTGEGGIITTNDEDWYKKLVQFRTHGITKHAPDYIKERAPWEYEMQFLGFNYRMTDIQAALGESQLDRLDKFTSVREAYADHYNKAFRNIKGVTVPFQEQGGRSSWHLYILKLDEELTDRRKKIFEALVAENIGVNVHYMPVYQHPYYQQNGCDQVCCPTAEKLYQQFLTLPLFPAMAQQDLDDVIEAVRKVLNYYQRGSGS
ncbi:UDP-4-amino-4,6-dideoxy-N-acetyl-beta-L-altrosamine transaminase [Halobacillus litoralis]|uniref:UDP-4-amino-4, 6-dideoxy-N-acetyl-beta-L-altrosamine transaminase n=1 Tax=Halobacillus litoralis TaxID=45668 RepID=UPI001CD710AF|nr:UDP-4-amino-4,6-dideoxy-N-acetyl-beta-L-altrosamine transaminase [Halobacillus litoralis]MCA1022080.1 UDP-4-amino-4,6-dideoxy-N-acetyl-beta-L-altrosamine transaminase [Halobacillus litoralis]